MSIQRVFRTQTVDEAARLLQEYGAEAQILAGGTDLLVQIREEKNRGSVMIDITDVKELSSIEITDTYIEIGAMVRFTDVVENSTIKAKLPGLWDACKSVGSPQIRNLGTLGGNLANGSPAADSAPPLLAAQATIKAVSTRGQRFIKLSEFYLGKGKTALELDELLVSIQIPFSLKEGGPGYLEFEKLGLRNALAISRISAAVYMELSNANEVISCSIASGSLGLNPMRESELENWFTGKTLSEETIKEGAKVFGRLVQKRLEGRSSMPYKKEAVQGVIKPALRRILAHTRNEG